LKTFATLLCLVLPLGTTSLAEPSEHVHCNLGALSKAERERDAQLIQVLHETLRERKELPDGYAYRFEAAGFKDVGEWLEIVAKCCQPLTYEVALAPQPGGAMWVRVTGKEGAKEFINLEFVHLTEKLDGNKARQ
jgi:hypothetical protein